VYVRFSIALFHSIFDYYAFDLIRLMEIDADEQGLDGTYWVSAWTARVCFRLLILPSFDLSAPSSLPTTMNHIRIRDGKLILMTGSGTKDGSTESPGENHLRIVPTRLRKFRGIHELFSREICSQRSVRSPPLSLSNFFTSTHVAYRPKREKRSKS